MSAVKTKQRFDAVRLSRRFQNPYYDQSDPRLWREELAIIRRMIDANYDGYNEGDHIIEERVYVEEIDEYARYWEWSIHKAPYSDKVRNDAVQRLIARGVIRNVRCAGGYNYMIFTDQAKTVLGLI